MNRSQVICVALAVALSVTGVTFAAAPALADHNTDEPILDGVFSDSSEEDQEESSGLEKISSGWDSISAGLEGARARAGYWIGEKAGGVVPFLEAEETTAGDQARALTTYYGNHNGTLEAYVNSRENFSQNHTVQVTIHLNDETATRYLLANESGGNVTTRVVKSTDRTPNESLEICGFAAASAYEELKHFTQNYAEPNKDVDTAYKARMKGRYGDDVETSLYPSGGECSGGGS